MTAQNDLLRDPLLALALLTRLPLKLDEALFERSAAAAWAYPLVGLVSALVVWAAGWGALALGLPVMAAAVLALAAGVLLTGAMHEDGLADCADGFWGGWDPAMRLKIMKDSQIGTYGVLALTLSLALRAIALSALFSLPGALPALLAAHVGSRAVMPILMRSMPFARQTGLAVQVGRVNRRSALRAGGIGLLCAVLMVGVWQGIWLALLVCAVTLGWRAVAMRKIRGQTGDVLGAGQQLAEVVILLALIAA